jgi:hypothetical protein
MCDLNLNTQADTKAWLLANHPDKGGQVDIDTFQDVTNCYKSRSYCTPGSTQPKAPAKGVQGAQPFNKKKRDKIFTCMRQTENWSKILPEHKMDKNKFDPALVKEAIHNASPKLEQLFRIIAQVDANDMQTHGKYFKHFIFSDVKEEGYGAKILASAFIANGYKNLIAPKAVPGQKALKLSLVPTGADGKDKAFGLLSSSPIFNSEFNQKFKKEVLRMYNQRPENIQGENMRFIILDSGFKEGIDLFDVKYVHIFEPSMTVADLKQTIGRATRTCGQKGLNFEPNVGWPLFVYNYYITVPEDMKEAYQVSDPSLLQYPEEDKNLFQKANKLKDATILFSGFDKTMTNLAEQLYKLAPVFSVDFELTKNIHRIDDMSYLYEQQRAQTDRGSARGSTPTTPIESASLRGSAPTTPRGSTPTTPFASPAKGGALNDNPVQCEGKCGLRSTKAIPATVGFLYKVYVKYGHPRKNVPAKHPRAYLCAYMKSHPDYCDQVNKEWANRAAFVPYLLDKTLEKNKTTSVKTTTKRTRKIKPATYLSVKPNSVTPYLSEPSSPAYMDIQPNKPPSYMDIQPNKPPSYMDIQPNKPPSYMDIQPNKPPSYVDIKAEPTPYNTPEKGTYLDFNAEPTEYMRSTPKSSSRKSSSTPKSSSRKSSSRKSSIRKSSSQLKSSSIKSSLKIASEIMQQLELVPYVAPTQETDYAIVKYTGKTDSQMKQEKPGPPPKKLNFQHMRDFIKTNYVKNFTWGEIVVENKCVEPVKAPAPPTTQAPATTLAPTSQAPTAQLGGASRIMSLNPTQDFVRTFFTPQSPYKGLLLFHSVGTGKCHAINTPIVMYDGRIKMVQDIVVGDKLMGDDSKPRLVQSLARGQDTLYDIIPTKGEKYTVNSEHILCLKYSGTGSITDLKHRQPNLPYKACHLDNKTVTLKSKSFATKEEAEHYLSFFKEEDRIVEIEVNKYLKLAPSLQRELKGYRKGVEFPSKPVDFDPYIIGLWLGDGSKRDPVISSQDAKILKYLMNVLPKYGLRLVHQSHYDYRISKDGTTKTNVMIDALRKYNLLNNKHIPYDYKCNDRAMRLQLLAGLIDTDGCYGIKDKCYEITQKSNAMAEDILFLARSLGFAAYNKKRNKSWTYKGVTNTNEYNIILISGNGLEEIPVQITRKMADVRLQIKDASITGIKVEKNTDCGDYYGFTLDGNCRYLLGDFTVTHNTCTAIATATASYEQEGYTILWVTRTTLKSDVYKNMFDDVCHIILAEKMKQGLIMPEDLTRRKKLLSKNWIEPISYKTFSNLLTPGSHNVYMDKLIQRNGTTDILKKTLIIIDEAHKLYGGDLKAGERPDMAVMERLLQKSYDISGKDSARLLIMTATPFTNSPLELFQLINLCKEDASEKIPIDLAEFKDKYMNADALLTEAGVKKLADKLSGYISYLNREQDPTQFAQPIMIDVPVIMSHLPDAELRRELFSQTDKQVDKLNKMESKTLNKQDDLNIKELNKRLRETQKHLKEMLKERQAHCKTIKNRGDKAKCMAEIQNEVQVEISHTVATIKEELERLKQRQEENKGLKQADQARIKKMKEKLETLKKELLQEVMLVERCKNIKLV